MNRCAGALLCALGPLSLLGCSQGDVAAPDFRVNVLGCYLPIPARYVANATNDEHRFYDSSADGYGSIVIDDYDKQEMQEVLSISDVLGSEERDGRVALLIAPHFDHVASEGFQVAILHDYDRMVSIYGDEVPNWREIFYSCIANPLPQKPPAHPEIDRVIRDAIEELLPASP